MPTSKKKRQQRAAAGSRKRTTASAPDTSPSTDAARPVLYSEVTTTIHANDNPITVKLAKSLIGWEESDERGQFKATAVPELKALYPVDVRLLNNLNNRPIYRSAMLVLKQEILRKRWQFNGEPIIVGRTGLILNGQHSLLALILAAVDWHENPERWPLWDEEPTMEKLVVYGVQEDDTIINTMDTCKPRSLADVIYRTAYFKDLPRNEQRRASQVCQFAIRRLWEAAGDAHAHSVKRTHSESMAFMEAHPKLLECVKHVLTEDNNEGRISRYLALGHASALMYLASACRSDPEKYFGSDPPTEDALDHSEWDKACDFFVNLAAGHESFKPLKEEMAAAVDYGAGLAERWALLVKAWNAYVEDEPLTREELALEFIVTNDVRRLAEQPLLGGIDVGVEGAAAAVGNNPTEDEIKRKAKEIRDRKETKNRTSRKLTPHRAGPTWSEGDTAWVLEEFDEPEVVTLLSDPYDCADGRDRVEVQASDGTWEVEVANLSLAASRT